MQEAEVRSQRLIESGLEGARLPCKEDIIYCFRFRNIF